MSEISIWIIHKTWLSTHISGGILSHSSLEILSKSSRFRGWCLETRTFSSLQRFSFGWRSGDWLGHYRTLMCFFLRHSFVALTVCFGSLSYWNTHSWPIFSAMTGLNALTLMVYGPVHRPFDAVQLSPPLSRTLAEILLIERGSHFYFTH